MATARSRIPSPETNPIRRNLPKTSRIPLRTRQKQKRPVLRNIFSCQRQTLLPISRRNLFYAGRAAWRDRVNFSMRCRRYIRRMSTKTRTCHPSPKQQTRKVVTHQTTSADPPTTPGAATNAPGMVRRRSP